jgi:hypothetical protein
MEVASFPETSVFMYETTRCHIQENVGYGQYTLMVVYQAPTQTVICQGNISPKDFRLFQALRQSIGGHCFKDKRKV